MKRRYSLLMCVVLLIGFVTMAANADNATEDVRSISPVCNKVQHVGFVRHYHTRVSVQERPHDAVAASRIAYEHDKGPQVIKHDGSLIRRNVARGLPIFRRGSGTRLPGR